MPGYLYTLLYTTHPAFELLLMGKIEMSQHETKVAKWEPENQIWPTDLCFVILWHFDFGVKILLQSVYQMEIWIFEIFKIGFWEFFRLSFKTERPSETGLIFLHGNMHWAED